MPSLSLLLTVGIGLAMWADSPESAWLVVVAVLAVVFVACRRAIARTLPERVRIEPAFDVHELAATRRAIVELQQQGFVLVGGPQIPNVVPAPVVFPLVHRDRGTLAAVYELREPKERTVVDLITRFASGHSLTTSNAREAATLPPPENRFLQTRHDAGVEALLALHQEGVATLRAVGLRTNSTASMGIAEFVHAMASHLKEQRERFDSTPVRSTTIALWRTLFGCRRHARPLAEQLGGGDRLPARATS